MQWRTAHTTNLPTFHSETMSGVPQTCSYLMKKRKNIIIIACNVLSHYKRFADITNVFVNQYQNQFFGGNWSKNLVSNKDRTSRSRSRDFCFCFKVLELDKPARLIIRLFFGFDKLNESTNSEMALLEAVDMELVSEIFGLKKLSCVTSCHWMPRLNLISSISSFMIDFW